MLSAKYTVVLKTLLDDENVKPLIDKAMSTYPTYTPKHEVLYSYIPTREELNKKILSYYKYREIGFETIGRFLDELETSLCEIMPYYNQLYKSVDIMNNIDDIFGNVDIVETFEQHSEGRGSGSSEGSSNSSASSESETNSNTNSYNKNVNSDTPQGNISTSNTGIDSVTHASNISWNHDTANDSATNTGSNTSSGTSTSSSNSENEEDLTHTLTKKGNQGVNTYAHDMLEFRELFMNIEQRIIHDDRIAELFMLVY